MLDYVWDNHEWLRLIETKIVPALTSMKTSSDNLDKLLGNINNNLTAFMTNFKDFSDTTKKFQSIIKQYFENANTFLMQIRDILKNIEKFYYPNSGEVYPGISKEDVYDIKSGWHSFWSTFRYKKFDEVLLDVHQKIEDLANPLSENNKGEFDSNIEKLKSDTAVGSALELKEGVQNLYTNVSGASPTASLNVNLLPVKFFGASVPAKTIKIDFSWYAPYRDTALSLWRFFLWTAYLFVLFKQIPSILQGFGLVTDYRIDLQDSQADFYYEQLVQNGGKDYFD